MINKEIRDYLSENVLDVIMFINPAFDNSIIGVSSDWCHIIYDYNKMIDEFKEESGCSYEEAVDFIEYNTLKTLPYIEDANRPIINYNLDITYYWGEIYDIR